MSTMKKNCPLWVSLGISFLLCSLAPVKADNTESDNKWNIAPFGDLCYWSDKTGVLDNILKKSNLMEVPQTTASEWNLGVCWKEARDINRIEIGYEGRISESFAKETKVEYWFQTWPGDPPRSHTIEDLFDDPWQGKWLTADVDLQIKGKKVVYTFKTLTKKENELANNLPGPKDYRRTLKIRLRYESNPPRIQSLKVFSPTNSKKLSLCIQFGCGKPVSKAMEGKLEIFNGNIERVSGWKWDSNDKLTSKDTWKVQLKKQPKGIKADLIVAVPTLPGSNDLTLVTVRSSEGNFSFSTDDLNHGPIYIPAYSVYITNASDTTRFIESNIRKGQTIREKLNTEPEQTYDRACREIPKLDVMLREDGGKLYLPLASDASWQKFGVEWGGGFFMNKNSSKAKGRELQRCNWEGDELHWLIGTGKEPVYFRDDKNSQMSILNDYLPVAEVSWNHEGLIYREEGFATLLEGPLSPYNKLRDEQTPAILMVRLSVSNPTDEERTAYIWLKGDSLEHPLLQDLFILDQKKSKNYIRAKIKLPEGTSYADIRIVQNAFELPIVIPANQTATLYLSVPFVGDLTDSSREKISSLDYSSSLQRVVSYWRDLVDEFTVFNVPERKFNEMARSVIPHIRMSATKDPKSGLFMVPAATFGYQVFSNESAFQIVYLDKIGDHHTAASYLETFLKLQGTDPMPGTFTGDQSAVFHGGKVDNEYNYTMGPYNLDHGTVLWALGQHYLMSRDTVWLKHASAKMLLAAEWIIEQRNQTKMTDKDGVPVLHYGLLPAGRLEDNQDWGFWFAINAYAYLGLHTAAEAFKKAGLPEAARLEKEALNYLHDLRTSVKRTSELSPVVRLRNNTYVPFIPSRVYQRFRYFGPMQSGYYSRYGKNTSLTYRLSATREALYGPMILISTGILDPHDPLSEAILDDWEDNITLSSSLGQHIHGVVDDEYWFSRGGMVFQPNLQNPIQSYLLRNEIPAAIRSIYNSMVACLYRDVNAFTEEYRRWGVGSGPMYKIPDEARFVNRVCDMLVMEAGNELWLAPGTPKYWLEPGKTIKLYNAATIFGNVSYELRSGKRPNTIEGNISLPENISSDKVTLFVHSPFEKPIKSVLVNGKEWNNWDRNKESIVLPAKSSKTEVLVTYEITP
jgi:hypothetical protein